VPKEFLSRLHEKGIFSPLDLHFARFSTRLAGEDNPELFLGAALVSNYRSQGHICLDLSVVEGRPLSIEGDGDQSLVCPELERWLDRLRKSPVVGKPGEYKPLILDDRSRLYLYRYWEYQEKLAGLINKRVCEERHGLDIPLLKEGLRRLYPDDATGEINLQKVAAFTALCKNFCVISGGPGTGKTTTVAKIIALMLEQAGSEKVRIALAAPTGKAASRLQEAIQSAKEKLDCGDRLKEAIPTKASTIHRLLGSITGSSYFRYNARNKLPVDAVIIDEASMVDLALMSKLVEALPPEARLILLGDKDQLASVEAGAVLGDICDSGNAHGFSGQFNRVLRDICEYHLGATHDKESGHGICDCIVQLQTSYRFGKDSGIGKLSRTVNEGDGDASFGLLNKSRFKDIRWKNLPGPDALHRVIKDTIINGFEDYLKADDPLEAFERFDRFRVLCALREGPYGVSALNRAAEQILKRAGLIESDKTWYPGRPVLITRNDYNVRLFNGDVGIVLPDFDANRDLRVFFSDADGTLRKLHPLRLPEHETVYAMTVHKSQGSEFDKVLLLLPELDYPVLTRELIYTGITRARQMVEIWGLKDVFRNAVFRRTARTSGLRDALWGRSSEQEV